MKPFLILVACLASTFAQCPSGWTPHPDGRRCFFAPNLSKTYEDARSYCRSAYSGILVTVNDDTDTTTCLAATKWGSTKQFWFGLRQDYTWDEGKTLSTSSYKNWKSGYGTYMPTKCNSFEASSGKWISGNLCTSLLPFICEAWAKYTCPFEKLQVSKNTPLIVETDGVNNLKTYQNYNCTKEISVAPDVNINENLHIRIKVIVDGGAHLIIRDIQTRLQITGWAYNTINGDYWFDEELNTFSRNIRIEAYSPAGVHGQIAYRIEFSTLSGQCPTYMGDGKFVLFDNGTRCLSQWATWDPYFVAQQYCRSKYGGYLGVIRSSKDIPAFNRATGGFPPMFDVWIGLYKNATTKTYVWDDGSKLGYTNWNTGPSSAVTDCVAYHRPGAKWITNTPCDTALNYVCETKAVRVCPFYKYQVSKGTMVSWETDYAGMGKTVTGYNCTFEVSVENKASETVFLKIKHYAKRNGKMIIDTTGVSITDLYTLEEFQFFGTTSGQWNYIEYDTKRSAVRVMVFVDLLDELGAAMYFEGKTI